MSKECGTDNNTENNSYFSLYFLFNKEEYVSRHNWCPKYSEDEYKTELKEDMKAKNF